MRVVLADDHSIFRSGLELLIRNSFNNVEIVSFSNGDDVLHYFNDHEADVVILDVTMPGKDGIIVCKHLKNKSVKKILLTMHNEIELVKLAILNGAKGYILKENTSEDLIECIKAVLEDKIFLSKEINYVNANNTKDIFRDKIVVLNELLSSTEVNILKQISQKKTSKDISDVLFISVKTVENYRSRICKKLELDARNNSLALWVMENKNLVDNL